MERESLGKWPDAESGAAVAPPAAARRRLVAAVLLAQLLSLCLAVTGVSSASLAAAGVALPTSQSVLNYSLLALTFGAARLARGGRLARPWWCYALLALADVEANFLVVKAYQYTSLTSVTLLDCFTIPAVILLSFVVLGARYKRAHYAAAAVCVSGLALLVASEGRSTTAGAAPLLGDALVVAGALLYAVSNVTQELYLAAASPAELLGMVGAFGALFAAAQAALLERGAWAALLSGGGAGSAVEAGGGGGGGGDDVSAAAVGAAFAAFTAALYTFSSLVPLVLVWGGATALNLSLLTSDMWAAAARLAWFGGFGGAGGWFAASLALVAVGLVMYASAGSPNEAPAAAAAAELAPGGGARAGGGFEACPATDEEVAPGGAWDQGQQQQQQRWRLKPQLPWQARAGSGGGGDDLGAPSWPPRPQQQPPSPAGGGAGWLEGVFAAGLRGGAAGGRAVHDALRRWGSPRRGGAAAEAAAARGPEGDGEERRRLMRPSLDGCESGPSAASIGRH